MFRQHRKSIVLFISAIFLTVLITTMVIQATTVIPSTIVISSGVYPGAPDWTVWTEGLSYFAKNKYGYLTYSGDNTTDVLPYVLAVGGSIFIKSGDYPIYADLNVPVDYTYVKGELNTHIIGIATTNYGFFITGNYTTIENVWVSNIGTTGINGFGITFENVTGGLVTHSKVTATGLDGIHFRRSTNCTASFNIVDDTGDDSIATLLGMNNIIISNHIDNHNYPGTNTIRGITVASENGTIVTGNTVANTPGSGILVTYMYADQLCDEVTISANTVRNAGTISPGGFAGNGIDVAYARRVTVTGNVIADAYWNGIHIYYSNFSTVSNNIISDCGKNATSWQAGIVLEYYSTSNIITGNNIDNPALTQEYGIVETSGGTNNYNVITACIVYGATVANIITNGANSKCNLCYNGTVWVA